MLDDCPQMLHLLVKLFEVGKLRFIEATRLGKLSLHPLAVGQIDLSGGHWANYRAWPDSYFNDYL
jgi:hypothetical protein